MNSFLLPFTTMSTIALIINIVALLGAILITYAVFLEAERRQDLVFTIGGICLFIYALWIGNKIFMIATGGLICASLFEFIQIILGIHKHSPVLEKNIHSKKN